MAFAAAAAPYLAAAAGLVGAVSAIGQGQSMAAGASYNAKVAEANAIQARNAALLNTENAAYRAKLLLGGQKAAAGASGVDPGQGSPLALMSETAAQTTFDQLKIKYQGDVTATADRNQAALDRFYASQYSSTGFLRAGASLLTGLTGFGRGFGGGASYPSTDPYYGP